MKKRLMEDGRELKVAYARSTWRKAKEFMEGVRELSSRMPLIYAREYLACGTRRADVAPELYERVDELQALRKAGIGGEMRYVRAQVYCLFRDGEEGPEFLARHSPAGLNEDEAADELARALAADEADQCDGGACARLLLGDAILAGDDIRFGVGPDLLYAAPSLGVYELFLWFDESELP